MKKFKFSLQKLLEYKEILLNEEISRIQMINKQIADCDENIKNVNDRMQYLNHSIGSRNKTYNAEVYVNYKRYIKDLGSLKNSFTKQKSNFEKNLEKCKDKAVVLQKEQKTIFSLKEKKVEEYKKEINAQEQLILDDLVSSRRV